MANSVESNSARARRKAPHRYEPSSFWQREVPAVARRKGVQQDRTAELQRQRGAQMAAAVAKGVQRADGVV